MLGLECDMILRNPMLWQGAQCPYNFVANIRGGSMKGPEQRRCTITCTSSTAGQLDSQKLLSTPWAGSLALGQQRGQEGIQCRSTEEDRDSRTSPTLKQPLKREVGLASSRAGRTPSFRALEQNQPSALDPWRSCEWTSGYCESDRLGEASHLDKGSKGLDSHILSSDHLFLGAEREAIQLKAQHIRKDLEKEQQ
ncbi:hypothetical protein AAY473_037350, partial [Plecturocebus cupreus]